MAEHYFISYSSDDAAAFALRLYDALVGGSPRYAAWLDKHHLQPGGDWETDLDDAIAACAALLFVLTPGSVHPKSVCRSEYSRALRYKKAVIPLQLSLGVVPPLRLETRQYIDFIGDFEVGMARLRQYLYWLNTPEGELDRMKNQLTDAERELARTADPVQQARLRDEIEKLKSDIARQGHLIHDLEGEKRRTEQSIARGLERERQPKPITPDAPRSRFINPPPGIAPDYFQDRIVETGELSRFLRDERQRLIAVVGRGGVGKTAMVCRLLKSLETGRLPGESPQGGESLPVDGIVYLSAVGSHRCEVPTLYADLCKLLPKEKADELDALYRDARTTITEKMQTLVANFPPDQRVVLLLDNFEDVIDASTNERRIKDGELNEALQAVLQAPPHGLKMMITTRVTPAALLTSVRPGLHRVLELDAGLDSPYAENILREMDSTGKLGLRTAADAVLKTARERTRGYPRALEALVAILEVDTDTSLDDLLANAEKLLPGNVVEVLVGEAFNRLDRAAQQVMQALAIYARPVPPVAVDYMLQTFQPGIDSAPILGRLVNMHFARKESGLYYLHPVDRQYALSRIPPGDDLDRFEAGDPVFTQKSLRNLGARYFASIRKPRAEWTTLADLQPQLDEFDLRCEGGDWDTAADVLQDIDDDYLRRWGYYGVLRDLHTRLDGHLADKRLQIFNARHLGQTYRSLGRPETAISYLQRALALIEDIGDSTEQSRTLAVLGYCYDDLGQRTRALGCYKQAMDIARAAGDRTAERALLSVLGSAHRGLGQMARALEYLERGLAMAREDHDADWETSALLNLGDYYYTLGQMVQAVDTYEAALPLARRLGNRADQFWALRGLGNSTFVLGQMARAITYYEQQLELEHAINDARGEGFVQQSLGRCYVELGQADHALGAYRQALDIFRADGHPRDISMALIHLGNGYLKLGRPAESIESFTQAVETSRNSGSRRDEGMALSWLGYGYIEADQVQAGIDYYHRAIAIHHESEDRLEETSTRRNLAARYAEVGQFEAAIDTIGQVLAVYQEIENRSDEAYALRSLAYYQSERGQILHALENYERALVIQRDLNARAEQARLIREMGALHLYTGQADRALDAYRQALALVRDVRDRPQECWCLTALGHYEAVMGQTPQAVQDYEQALEITREITSRPAELTILNRLGAGLIDQGKLDEAARSYTRSFEMAGTMGSKRLDKYLAQLGLARVSLYTGDVPAALEALNRAESFHAPDRRGDPFMLRGILALRQGDATSAHDAFVRALAAIDARLAASSDLYGDLDARGLTLCGLVICGKRDQLSAALETFQQARRIATFVGEVRTLLRLFDALAVCDTEGILKDARLAAGGTVA